MTTARKSVKSIHSTGEESSSGELTPIRSLVQSRDITKLWALRMMVKLGATYDCFYRPGRRGYVKNTSMLRRLGLPDIGAKPDEVAADQLNQRIELTLELMEKQAHRYSWSRTVDANLRLLDKAFSLSMAEKTVFVFAAWLRTDDDLRDIAQACRPQVDVTDQLHRITGLSVESIRRAVSPQSALRRSGLIVVLSGGPPSGNLDLRRSGLRCIVSTRLKSIDQLFGGALCPANAPTLTRQDYAYLNPDFDFICNVMKEALKSGRPGVNVLLYGPPGTGKTELTRVIAEQSSVPLYDVSCVDENGQPVDARSRLANASTAQYLLRGRKALLVFDEIDAIFNDGSAFFGKPTTAEQSKAWVNELLEGGYIPTFWVANAIWNMDPAFVRRFDVVIEMAAPPLQRRVELLAAQCGTMLDADQIRRLAQVETITPALVTRAASVMQRSNVPANDQAATLETLLDGTLVAQGHKTIKRSNRGRPVHGYDPDLCNASMDLRALAEGVTASGVGRICLYGPPGTGKTAFGYWLAEQLGKPLMLKRVSDIQSPMLGVMERNLAQAFEQAARDGAVLQIDEVDTFLRDRSEARQSWEVSQVNEFLTQLESYEGVFIASTNLMGGLDPAALRRFDYKVEMDYLLPHQADAMLAEFLRRVGLDDALSASTHRQLASLHTLTPGDFAVLQRQHHITPFVCVDTVVAALTTEVVAKESMKPRRIGFV
jgi:SpoVK/Ycf46/Vps4 family AAA+-type ATPase